MTDERIKRVTKQNGPRPRTTLRTALSDKNLLGSIISGKSWKPWRTLLIAAMGEELTPDERALFKELTQRDHEPKKRVEDGVFVVGRRGGKSRAISVLVSYISGLCRHPNLVPGERGVALVIAPDQKQATIVLNYVKSNFERSPILRQLVRRKTARSIELTNGIDVEVRTSDFRNLRGPSYICIVQDESAFFLSENSSNPDYEILNAVRPGLATTGGSLFIISSPYAKRGALWDVYRKHFGPQGDPAILVAQGTSRQFNSTLSQSVVDRAMERDPAWASAEYLALFRTDIEAFISLEAVNACVSRGVRERDPRPGVHYHGFCDPSGGSADSMTLAIAHIDRLKQAVVIDCLREVRPPFSPEGVCFEFAETLRSYGITSIIGDRFAGEWVREQFGKANINYNAAAKPKSELYLDLLPLINSRRIEILDHPRSTSQLVGLERRTARGGRDSIDHSPGAHDDLSNAIAGAASFNVKFGSYDFSYGGWDDSNPPDGSKGPTFLQQRLNDYVLSGGTIRQ